MRSIAHAPWLAPRELRPAAPGHAAAPPIAVDRRREAARRRVVALVFAIYLLAILEGALRKWVVPQFSQYVFFIRDPLLILAYALAFRHGLWPRRSPLLKLVWAAMAVGVLLFLLQAAAGAPTEWRLLLGVYGWRAYFLYVPLMFLVGAVFEPPDLHRLFVLTLALALPIALLVAAQFAASPGAPINVGTADEKELQFRGLGLNAERTRPMGPFASGAGQQQFVASAFAVLVAWFIAPRGVRQPGLWFLLLAAAGVATCIALSGSRGTVLQCALTVAFAGLLAGLGRGGAVRSRALLWPLVLAGAAVVLYPLLFPAGFEAFVERWIAADRAESRTFETGVFGRALYGLVDFVRLLDVVPLLGYGLGFGGNASITLGVTVDGVQPGRLVETDFARHMVDIGPLAGIAYIALRLAIAVWLAGLVLRASRLAPDPMPMLLLSYVAYVLVFGQITGQGTINFYGWLFAGLLLAACRAAGACPQLGRPRPGG